MVESKNSNGLGKDGQNAHPAGKAKGQRAMAIAMLSPEPEDVTERGKKGGRGKKAPTSGEVSSQRIADARAVLAYSLELAEAVMRHPDPEKGGRGKKGATCGEFSDVAHQRVSEARAQASPQGRQGAISPPVVGGPSHRFRDRDVAAPGQVPSAKCQNKIATRTLARHYALLTCDAFRFRKDPQPHEPARPLSSARSHPIACA